MNMATLILTVFLPVKVANLTVILMLLMASGTAQADTGYISLTGNVQENTCTLDSGSASQTVSLPDISTRDITAVGPVNSSKTEIPIILRNCGADVTSVTVNTSGTAHGSNANLFDNIIPGSTAGRATGLGVFLFQTNASGFFYPNGTQAEIIKLNPSADNALIFYAAYGATTTSITPGNVQAVINMSFDYP